MLMVLTCLCGGVENLSRRVLQRAGHPDYMKVPIHKGREKSLAALNTIPQFQELEPLRNFLKEHTRYAVVLGFNDKGCRWANAASPNAKEVVDTELIIDKYK